MKIKREKMKLRVNDEYKNFCTPEFVLGEWDKKLERM